MTGIATAPASPTASEPAEGGTTGPRRLVRVLAWVAFALVALVGALAVWAAGQDSTAGTHARSPEDPSPRGAMAVAEVLRQQGVEVVVTRSFRETQAAIGDGDGTTLLIDDDWWVLTPEAYDAIRPLSRHLVLVAPFDDVLLSLAPGVDYAGFAGGAAEAECALGAAVRAERIQSSGSAYTGPADAERCFPTADGDGYSVVRVEDAGREVTVLGAADALRNDRVLEEGNAAFALGLLGERPRLVWYQPDIDDYSFQPSDTLASFQAAWYLPLVVLVLLVGVAAALWRGRWMGPVVVEDLPVEVRSSETMEGRARLYERGGAGEHALGTLRAATVARLARTLGLPRTASVREVADAAAAIGGRDPASVLALLDSARAIGDRDLVRLSDELLRLERDVARGMAS